MCNKGVYFIQDMHLLSSFELKWICEQFHEVFYAFHIYLLAMTLFFHLYTKLRLVNTDSETDSNDVMTLFSAYTYVSHNGMFPFVILWHK